ncbi:MAG: Lrp/AsnC family transcriptional regulator [Parvibaculales bacterium]
MSNSKTNQYEFSELDIKIIEMLKADGRASNQRIADELGVSTSIVATRIRRMENAKAMKIVAVSDFSALNHNVLLPIGVDVKGRNIEEVAEDLAAIHELSSVQICAGKHEIQVLVALEDMTAVSQILLDKISKVEGVSGLEPAIAVDIVKYKFDVAPI